MPWIICFPVREPKGEIIADLNREVCFVLPIATLPKLGQLPPVFTHSQVGDTEVRGLQGLASIDELAAELPDHLSHDIRQSVTAHMQSLGKRFGADVDLSRRPA